MKMLVRGFLSVSRGMMILPLVVVAACGSSSKVDPMNSMSTAAAISEARTIVTNPVFDVRTPVADLPTGAVTYSGFAIVASETTDLFLDNETEISNDPLFAIGRATINADFDSSSMTGTANNFIDGNDNQLSGQLTLTATPTLANAAVYNAEVIGQISAVSGESFEYNTAITLEVAGPNGEGITGDGQGSINVPDDSGVDVETAYIIGFFGKQ